MSNWLHSLSKGTLAFLAIGAGIAFIIISQPPYTVCDSQVELIQESQKHFLFSNPKIKVVKTTPYQALRERCKSANNPGGCYELFQKLNGLCDQLTTLPTECVAAGGEISEVKTALWESIELILRIAWGEKPPSAYNAKFGWLDTADVALFCRLKDRITVLYGENAFNRFRERMMQSLPGAKDLSRNQVWELTLFSENCTRYP